MINKIFDLECPRYIQKKVMRNGEWVAVIVDSHSMCPERHPVMVEPLEGECDRLNDEYESYLRKVLM